MSRSASSTPDESAESTPKVPGLAEVRYSLPEMLAELKLERTTGCLLYTSDAADE